MRGGALALPTVPRRRALTPRERLFLAVGAGAALLLLLFLLLPSAASDEPVEIVQAPAAAAPPPAYVSSPPPPPAPAPAADVSGLVLKGVLASGAIIAFPQGERVVPIGREFLPGLTLKAVGVSHAIVAGAGGEVRIELGRAGAAPVEAAAAAPAPGADHQRETMQYRIGLQPVTARGRVAGFAIRPGASLPHLGRAGLQPGDVIVAVNGSAFDEERLMELSWQIANSGRTELEYVRNGRRMKAAIEGGQ